MNVTKLRHASNQDAKIGTHVIFEEPWGTRKEYVISKIVKEGTAYADSEVMIKPYKHRHKSMWTEGEKEMWQLEVEAQ